MTTECPYHHVALVRAVVRDSRGRETTFLRCPAGFNPGMPLAAQGAGFQACKFMRPLKLYTQSGGRQKGRKTTRGR